MNKFIVITECAIEYHNKFLIIKRPKGVHAEGLLAFPGGKVEIYDNAEDICKNAIKREVLEEVGLDLIDDINYITTSYFQDDKGHSLIDIIYYCKLNKTLPNIKASPREVPEYYWLTYDEIINSPNCPEWMLRYMQKIYNTNQEN